MLVHGVKGGVWDRSCGSHGTGQHPQHCQHHPQDADDAGECGHHTIGGGGGGGTWPRDWYIYIYIRKTTQEPPPHPLRPPTGFPKGRVPIKTKRKRSTGHRFPTQKEGLQSKTREPPQKETIHRFPAKKGRVPIQQKEKTPQPPREKINPASQNPYRPKRRRRFPPSCRAPRSPRPRASGTAAAAAPRPATPPAPPACWVHTGHEAMTRAPAGFLGQRKKAWGFPLFGNPQVHHSLLSTNCCIFLGGAEKKMFGGDNQKCRAEKNKQHLGGGNQKRAHLLLVGGENK